MGNLSKELCSHPQKLLQNHLLSVASSKKTYWKRHCQKAIHIKRLFQTQDTLSGLHMTLVSLHK